VNASFCLRVFRLTLVTSIMLNPVLMEVTLEAEGVILVDSVSGT
jgi:hypothetical protein